MDQGKIVSRSWDITWDNKALWGLGFLAALTTGSSGSSNSGNLGQGFTFDPSSGELPPIFNEGPLAEAVGGNIDVLLPMVAGLFAFASILILVSILFWIISHAARAGLIRSVATIGDGETIIFSEALKGGWRYVFRIFIYKVLLFLIVIVPIVILVAIVAAIGFGTGMEGVFILICPLICIFIPVIIAIQFTDAYGYRGLVLQEMRPTVAIRHGWQLFRSNFADSLILGVIYGLVGMVFSFAIAFVIGFIAVLSANPIMTFFESGELSTAMMVQGALAAVVVDVIMALLMSVFTAWQSTGFTLAYQEMTGVGVSAEKEPTEKGPEDVNFDSMI